MLFFNLVKSGKIAKKVYGKKFSRLVLQNKISASIGYVDSDFKKS